MLLNAKLNTCVLLTPVESPNGERRIEERAPVSLSWGSCEFVLLPDLLSHRSAIEFSGSALVCSRDSTPASLT